MKSLPVTDDIHMEGMVSRIVYIGARCDLITKNGKLSIIFFLTFILCFIKWELIPILTF